MQRLTTFITVLIALGSVQSATIHVPADQSTIQAGIDSAQSGDTVLVADGTYKGDGNRDIDFGGKNVVLKSENGPELTLIDCEGTEVEPHRAFHFHGGEDTTAVVEGFTIRNGYFGYGSPVPADGGGIRCENSSPTIKHNIISSNHAWGSGGGVSCRNANPVIKSNTISSNIAVTCGTGSGGGISCDSSSPTIVDNIIVGNVAYAGCAMMPGSGGGIGCVAFSNPVIRDNIISGNAGEVGGGIACWFYSDPLISHNVIDRNAAEYWSGGIQCQLSNATIIHNTISGNSGLYSGGGIGCEGPPSPIISHNVITGNVATGADGSGGGITCFSSSDAVISNNTICGNTAVNGGGIEVDDSSPSISNCIIAFNNTGGSIACYYDSNPLLMCCDVYGNEGGDWVGCIADQAGINGNMSHDPLFCDTATQDYGIESVSPCTPSNPLNQCGQLIGAEEPPCGPSCCLGTSRGNIDCEGISDVGDVTELIRLLFIDVGQPFCCEEEADLDDSGIIDIGDLTWLIKYLFWLAVDPPPCP